MCKIMSVSFSYFIKMGYPAHMEDPYANYWMELSFKGRILEAEVYVTY